MPPPFPDGFIGEVQSYRVGIDESLIEIARRFDLGYNSIVDANPGVDPFVPRPGTLITIPTAWIPPFNPSPPGIIVNVAELRLYYYPNQDADRVITFPLGIGDEGNETPLGNYLIREKIVNPSWYVPASIARERPGMPRVVPPGPRNPLGSHALRLSRDGILIHGTNRPWGIGRRSSHGCLRLYQEDIAKLFELARQGMHVVVVNQPIKVGIRGGRIFLEVHREEDVEPDVGTVMRLLNDWNLLAITDFAKLVDAIKGKKGLPVEVTLDKAFPKR